MTVDTHVHVGCADTTRYPRSPRGVGSDWWKTGDHGSGPLVAAMDAAGVARAVVVQAVGPYGYDCRCAIDAVGERPDRLRLVVAVDPTSADPAADLSRLAHHAPVAGVRVFCVGGADEAWLTDGRGAAVWALAGELGIVVVPTVFPTRLQEIRDLAEAHPGVPVALDHAGFPDLPLAADAPVLALADVEWVHLKVSSHLLGDAPDAAALVRALAARFGAERLCWGSDYPQTSTDYAALLAAGVAAAEALDSAGRTAFLTTTADRLWA